MVIVVSLLWYLAKAWKVCHRNTELSRATSTRRRQSTFVVPPQPEKRSKIMESVPLTGKKFGKCDDSTKKPKYLDRPFFNSSIMLGRRRRLVSFECDTRNIW